MFTDFFAHRTFTNQPFTICRHVEFVNNVLPIFFLENSDYDQQTTPTDYDFNNLHDKFKANVRYINIRQ